MDNIFCKDIAFVVENARGKRDVVAESAQHEFATCAELAERRVHVWIWGAAHLHHAPEELLCVDVGDRWVSPRKHLVCIFLLRLFLQVFRPYFGPGELLLKRGEPRVVELDFAPLNELPCACIVGSFLDRKVDVANGDFILDFVVEDCLERADDLELRVWKSVMCIA